MIRPATQLYASLDTDALRENLKMRMTLRHWRAKQS